MSVSLLRQVRLRVGAGSAKPGPAIGQALGPLGLVITYLITSTVVTLLELILILSSLLLLHRFEQV